MATSQNGWPVVHAADRKRKIDERPINGHRYPNGFLKGDVYAAFVWLFTQLDTRVEKVAEGTPSDEWGYNVREIEGSDDWSNHSSGTAGDYNASQHGMGGSAHAGYNERQVAEIHEILREANGIFRWGGDYKGRKDPMHFEIAKGEAAVSDFVDSIQPREGRKLKWEQFDVTMPVLKQGDNDDDFPGYDRIKRIQRLAGFTGADVDGAWGPKTSAKLGYKEMNIKRWRDLMGLGDPK